MIHGRVQGVFFRDSTRRRAESLGVAGCARNLPDGTVEVVVEGEVAAVAAVERFCREGPRGASVERVDAYDEPAAGLRGFAVA